MPLRAGERLKHWLEKQNTAVATVCRLLSRQWPLLVLHPLRTGEGHRQPVPLPAPGSAGSQQPRTDQPTAARTEGSHPTALATHSFETVSAGAATPKLTLTPHKSRSALLNRGTPPKDVGNCPRILGEGRAGPADAPAPYPSVAPSPSLSDCHLVAWPRPGPTSRGQGRVGERW